LAGKNLKLFSKEDILSVDEIKAMVRRYVDEIIVEGDRVAYHWKMCATNDQGKLETTVGITLLRLVGGKIVEDRYLSGEVKPA
jgi:hypothetical protein